MIVSIFLFQVSGWANAGGLALNVELKNVKHETRNMKL
jgi:hypothetical protein